jgi:hypothetical protein
MSLDHGLRKATLNPNDAAVLWVQLWVDSAFLNFNEATIVEVVQLWADSTFVRKVKVLSVKALSEAPRPITSGVVALGVIVKFVEEPVKFVKEEP